MSLEVFFEVITLRRTGFSRDQSRGLLATPRSHEKLEREIFFFKMDQREKP